MRCIPRLVVQLSLVVIPVQTTSLAFAQDEADIAKQLANPVASLISVPIQANYDEDFGPLDEGSMLRVNVQPVIPITLNDDWNLISRTILPIVDQDNIPSA